MYPQAPDSRVRPTLIFTSGDDPFSLSVQMVTMSAASHVVIGFGDEIIHAIRQVRHEARSRLYTKYKYTEVAEFEIVPDVTPGVQYLVSQVGKPYDFDEVISGLFMRSFQFLMPTWQKNAIATQGKWTCARLAMALDPYRNRIPEWWSVDPEGATPAALLQTMGGASFRRIK